MVDPPAGFDYVSEATFFDNFKNNMYSFMLIAFSIFLVSALKLFGSLIFLSQAGLWPYVCVFLDEYMEDQNSRM